MITSGPRTAIVVPCYNEAKRLRVEDFESFLGTPQLRIVLIFVNDGSRDNTAELLRQFERAHPDKTEVVDMPVNSGKGEAVRTGINHGLSRGYTFVGFWDADLATPLESIGDLLSVLEGHPEVDMVFGSRVKLLGRMIERKASRHYMGRAFATAVSTTLRLPVYDTQCGAKIFRSTPQIREIFRDPFLSRWIFDVEIIARYMERSETPAAAAKRIYEYPLRQWKDISGSKLFWFDFFYSAWDLFRISRKYEIRGSRGRTRGVE
jgi:dolichyl-phosphate beta-glucosyltransferase